MEAAHFVPSFRHSQFISRVKDDIGHDSARAAMRQTFIKHYYDKYGEPELPRSWMVFETLTFGTVSQAFKNRRARTRNPSPRPWASMGPCWARGCMRCPISCP